MEFFVLLVCSVSLRSILRGLTNFISSVNANSDESKFLGQIWVKDSFVGGKCVCYCPRFLDLRLSSQKKIGFVFFFFWE